MEKLTTYNNGNAVIDLFDDGTRIIQFDETLKLDFPLNIDIRVSTACTFGYNPNTGKSTCSFCHESARTDGTECDYEELKSKLIGLPKGIELAIGGNKLTRKLTPFLEWAKDYGFICNLTVNQMHINGHNASNLIYYIRTNLIRGLGISYRKGNEFKVNEHFINYPNTVFHVIVGIDSVDDVLNLRNYGVKKVLCLGEKDFGFNIGNVDLNSQLHKEWYWWVHKLFDAFDVVSFDNLAIEQLNIKRFLPTEKYDEFNQGEHSFYINAVDKYFAPSSRSSEITPWNGVAINEYFKTIDKN